MSEVLYGRTTVPLVLSLCDQFTYATYHYQYYKYRLLITGNFAASTHAYMHTQTHTHTHTHT